MVVADLAVLLCSLHLDARESNSMFGVNRDDVVTLPPSGASSLMKLWTVHFMVQDRNSEKAKASI
uniref:Uncharacterized protein n=1 Tax=Oryza meridionalis TaxID=40149 RepID=A0A0E0DG69_9ORYZ